MFSYVIPSPTGFHPNQATEMKPSSPSREGLTGSLPASVPSTPSFPSYALDFPSLSFYPQALWKWPQMGRQGSEHACRTLYTRAWQAFNINAIRGLTLA